MNNPSKIITVIQARMSSTRLPGKVMFPLLGKPLLLNIYERITNSKHCGTVVIATSTYSADETIYSICKSHGIEVFRGSSEDLLDRHLQAGIYYDADVVIKIPSDCPLISPSVIDEVIDHYLSNHNNFDYVSNLHPATYPDGNDVEVIPINTLKIADKKSMKNYEREHTTPFIWENPSLFRIGNVAWKTGFDYSMTHRWTIDYPEDYSFIKAVYNEFNHNKFDIEDILELLKKVPGLNNINSQYAGVNWYRHHLNELTTITSRQTRKIPHEEKSNRT